jgi:C-terminal processing protease CtpA/Prc
MPTRIVARIAVVFMLLFVSAHPSRAADQKLGFVTQVEGEGFFLNPLVTKILVTEVTKGSLADAAGMRPGDQIIQIEGQSVAGRRARELQPFMKLNPGETRTLRLKRADGTEVDARITKPKT